MASDINQRTVRKVPIEHLLTLPAPIGARVLDRSRTFLFHSSLPGEQLGYRIKVPVVRTFTVTNQPKLSRSHTNSTDLTSRLPDGRSTRDHRKIAAYEQTLKRSAPRAPVLYHRPIGRCFTTGWVKAVRLNKGLCSTAKEGRACCVWLLRSAFSRVFRARCWDVGMLVHFKSQQRHAGLSWESPSGEASSCPSLCQTPLQFHKPSL